MLHLSEEQAEKLNHLRGLELLKITEMRFDRIDDDQQNIRRQIYLQGGIDMISYLLEFDLKLEQKLEAEKQQLLQNNEPESGSNLSTF